MYEIVRKMEGNAKEIMENAGKNGVWTRSEKVGKDVAERNAHWPHNSLRGSRYGFGFCINLLLPHTAEPGKGLAVFNRSAHSARPRLGSGK